MLKNIRHGKTGKTLTQKDIEKISTHMDETKEVKLEVLNKQNELENKVYNSIQEVLDKEVKNGTSNIRSMTVLS